MTALTLMVRLLGSLTIFVLWAVVPSSAFSQAPVLNSNSTDTTRIVSLVPSLTEMLFAIGAGAQVAGVSDYCKYPPEATKLPAVGGLVNPSLEGVLALRPKVVLLYRSQRDFANRLAQLDIQAELFQVDTLADIYAAVERIGVISGETSGATALSHQLQSVLQDVREKAQSQSQMPISGIVVVSRDPGGLRQIYQAGSGNFLGELFQIAGGKLAIPGDPAISVEDIIRAQPNVIIDLSTTEAQPGKSPDSIIRNLAGPWAALSTVPAVQRGHIYEWNNAHGMVPGPSVLETVVEFHHLLTALRSTNRHLRQQ